MRTAAFIVNRARVRDAPRLLGECRLSARAAGYEPLLLPTPRQGSGMEQAREGVEAGAALVVALGGDGTVRACAEALAGTEVPLGIVPLGTANLAARELGLPRSLTACLDVALRGRDRRVDLGRASGMTFLAMAGLGLDAAVVRATPLWAKRRWGWAGYAGAGLTQLSMPPARFRLRLDGRELSCSARSVVVGNVGLLPGGFALLPDARPDDGILDAGVLAPPGLGGWLQVGWRVLSRGNRSDGLLTRVRAREIEVRADRELLRQVDGEMLAPGRTLSVRVLPGALTVRVPPLR